MDRKLLNYLPPVLRAVIEMQVINRANEPEIFLAWNGLNRVMANQFLDDADERGVSVWEQELKISPKDTDTLARRKVRIKAMWKRSPPYTISWLNNWLTNICGAGSYRVVVTDYTLELWLDASALQESDSSALDIMEMLREILPANLRWKIIVSLKMVHTIYFGGSAGAQVQIGVPLELDAPELQAVLYTGGTGSIRASLPVPEDPSPPSATTILRTGGVCTIISNLSKGE